MLKIEILVLVIVVVKKYQVVQQINQNKDIYYHLYENNSNVFLQATIIDIYKSFVSG